MPANDGELARRVAALKSVSNRAEVVRLTTELVKLGVLTRGHERSAAAHDQEKSLMGGKP